MARPTKGSAVILSSYPIGVGPSGWVTELDGVGYSARAIELDLDEGCRTLLVDIERSSVHRSNLCLPVRLLGSDTITAEEIFLRILSDDDLAGVRIRLARIHEIR